MPRATLADFRALASEVAKGTYPILPRPEWGQDAAMIAFFFDGVRKELADLRASISQSDALKYEMLKAAIDEIEAWKVIVRWSLEHDVSELGEPYRTMVQSCIAS